MEILKENDQEDSKLKFLAFAYHGVMLGAFIVGMYGLVSLLSLATAHLENTVQVIGSLK